MDSLITSDNLLKPLSCHIFFISNLHIWSFVVILGAMLKLLLFSLLKDGNITLVSNEAKDNVKYLYTLEKFFKPLGKCTPVSYCAVFLILK